MKNNDWEGRIVELTERIVIHYANLSGRADNRAQFREEVITLLRTEIEAARQEGREETVNSLLWGGIKRPTKLDPVPERNTPENLSSEFIKGWNAAVGQFTDALEEARNPR